MSGFSKIVKVVGEIVFNGMDHVSGGEIDYLNFVAHHLKHLRLIETYNLVSDETLALVDESLNELYGTITAHWPFVSKEINKDDWLLTINLLRANFVKIPSDQASFGYSVTLFGDYPLLLSIPHDTLPNTPAAVDGESFDERAYKHAMFYEGFVVFGEKISTGKIEFKTQLKNQLENEPTFGMF